MKSTRKIIFLALMVGCGIMLQIIESVVPVVIFVPGLSSLCLGLRLALRISFLY